MSLVLEINVMVLFSESRLFVSCFNLESESEIYELVHLKVLMIEVLENQSIEN